MYGLGASLQYPSIDAAITKFETGNNPSAVGFRNNNPGNLVFSSWMAPYGCSAGGAGGFAQCPTLDAGQQVLDARVTQLVNQGNSISDLLYTWAGPQYPGNTQASYDAYVSSVASDTGLDPNAPISAQLSIPDLASQSSGNETLSSDVALLGPSTNWALVGAAAAGAALLLFALS